MAKFVCRHDEFGDICKILDQISHNAEDMAVKAFDGLMRHSRKSLDEAEKIGASIETGAKQLTQLALSAKDMEESLDSSTIVEVCSELKKIKYSLDKIIGSIRTKADEGVLFSDKAMLELKDFFSTAIDGLKHVHDLILTQNPVLISHIIQRAENYEEVARKYAEEHQDRLIRGICLPKSSLVYLLILDSLKDIIWYIKTIALAFKEE